MKKFLLLLISLFIISLAYGQWCVTLHKTGGKITSYGSNITVLEIAPNGDIYFNMIYGGGLGWGLGKLSGTTLTSWYSGSIPPHPVVNAIAFDKNDSVWVATDGGLAQFDGTSTTGWRVFKTPTLTTNKVSALMVDRNNVKWIGLGNGDIMTLENNTWTLYDSIGPENNKIPLQGQINDMDTAIDGSIWIAKNEIPGIVKYKDGTWTLFNTLENIRHVTTDQYGRTLVPADDSLVIIYNDQIVNIVKPNQTGVDLFDVAVGPAGRIWVSSNKGLLLKVGDTFRAYSKANSAIPDLFSPIPLKFDPEGNLWFSFYYSSGVNSYPGIGYIYRGPDLTSPIVIANKPSAEFCYGDSIILDANADANTYIWSNGSNTRTISIGDNAELNVAYPGTDNCYYYDTIKVIAQHVFENEKPCVVTVSNDNKNLLVWEKTPEVGTESYNIYREVQTDSFEFRGNVPAGNLSVFRDQNSDPRQRSYKYKISSVDTCGNESGQSFFHKTMHLTVNLGVDTTEVNLIWQNYEGFSFPYYIIYKGTSIDNLLQIATIPVDEGVLTYTDYGVIGRHYYRIGVALPFICIPTGNAKADSGPYSHSMSNIEDNRLQDTGSNYIEPLLSEICSYPNPFSYWTQIDFENSLKYPYQLRVTDLSGKLVRIVGDIRDDKVIFLRENLPQGFYMFELKGDRVYRGKFVIK